MPSLLCPCSPSLPLPGPFLLSGRLFYIEISRKAVDKKQHAVGRCRSLERSKKKTPGVSVYGLLICSVTEQCTKALVSREGTLLILFYETRVNILKSINLHQGQNERQCFTLAGDLRSFTSCPYSKEGNETSDVVSDSLRTQQPESDQSLHVLNSNSSKPITPNLW